MKLTKVNKVSEIKLNTGDLKLDFEIVDKSFKVATLTDKNGRVLKLRSDYWMTVEQTEEPEMVKKFKVSGAVSGMPMVDALYDSKFEAEQAIAKLASVDNTLEVSEVEVPAE